MTDRLKTVKQYTPLKLCFVCVCVGGGGGVNEGARVLTRLNIDLSDAQGQLTPQSVVESRQNSNSTKLLWLSLLPARMKKIQSKMKALEC